MKEHPALYVGIIITLVGVAIIWGSQQPERLTPLEMLERSAQQLDTACASACAGAPAEVILDVPTDTRMYTTGEAVCLQRNTSMFCARCPCTVMPSDLPTSSGPSITCRLTGEPVQVSCS